MQRRAILMRSRGYRTHGFRWRCRAPRPRGTERIPLPDRTMGQIDGELEAGKGLLLAHVRELLPLDSPVTGLEWVPIGDDFHTLLATVDWHVHDVLTVAAASIRAYPTAPSESLRRSLEVQVREFLALVERLG